MDEWVEAQLLPTNQRDAYYESALIDYLVTNLDWSDVTSLIDIKKVVEMNLKKISTITVSGVASGALDRLTRKLFLYLHTKRVEVDSTLDKLLKSIQKGLKITTPLVEQVYEDGASNLVITVPDYDKEDEDTAKVLVLLIGFCCTIHQTDVNNLKINVDSKLGSGKLTISSTYRKLVSDLTVSAKHPSGLYAGERYTFKSSFTGTVVDMIAAMRLLNHKQEFIRKRKFPNKSNKTPTSFNDLQETFNASTGLKGTGEQSFVQKFIKASLSSAVKKHNKGFPGGWIHSSRTSNNVKGDSALLNVLGWTEKCPSNLKMLEVLFNTVDPVEDPKSKEKFRIVNLTQDKRNMLHQEFRTAVCLTLPRIDTSKPDNHESDMKIDPLSVKDLTICNNFVKSRRDCVVDALNESYALRVSLKNPKSKTKEVHYKIFRDRLLGSSANVPLIDAKGKLFNNFSSLPPKTQKFLRDKFRYPIKRTSEETTEEMAVDSNVEETGDAGASAPPLKRRKKITRGQAKEAVRKSGRLAALRKESE